MRCILVNDIHLSDRPPSSCTDTYLDDLFDLLYQITGLAAKTAAEHIILAGDIFHHKAPSRTSHATLIRLLDWAQHTRETASRVHAVLGNHDLSHDRVASIDETQPLGVALTSGVIELLDGWMDGGSNAFVYGVPWQMTFDDQSVSDALEDYRTIWYSDDTPKLVVTHAPLYPPGQELPYEFYPVASWAAAMGNNGTVHYGHVHSPHGVYQWDGVTFSNSGALSRGSLTESNLTRDVQVAVWDSDTGLIEHVTLAAKPAQDVFRLPEVNAQRAAQIDLTTFLGSVGQTQLSITSTESVIEHIRGLGFEPDLEHLLTLLLEEAQP